MSNSVVALKTIKIVDPIIKQEKDWYYPVLEGGSSISYQEFLASSSSQSTASFNIPTPGPDVFIDRQIKMKMPVTINFVGESRAAGTGLL